MNINRIDSDRGGPAFPSLGLPKCFDRSALDEENKRRFNVCEDQTAHDNIHPEADFSRILDAQKEKADRDLQQAQCWEKKKDRDEVGHHHPSIFLT